MSEHKTTIHCSFENCPALCQMTDTCTRSTVVIGLYGCQYYTHRAPRIIEERLAARLREAGAAEGAK